MIVREFSCGTKLGFRAEDSLSRSSMRLTTFLIKKRNVNRPYLKKKTGTSRTWKAVWLPDIDQGAVAKVQ